MIDYQIKWSMLNTGSSKLIRMNMEDNKLVTTDFI